MAPIVTGEVNPAALEDLVRLCVQLDQLRHHRATATGGDGTDGDGTDGDGDGTSTGEGTGSEGTGGDGQPVPAPDTALAWEALERAIIGKTIDFLLHFLTIV